MPKWAQRWQARNKMDAQHHHQSGLHGQPLCITAQVVSNTAGPEICCNVSSVHNYGKEREQTRMSTHIYHSYR